MPNPIINPQQQTIDRRRAMAQALQAESMAPLQSPGVRGARISPWEGVSKIAQSLMGNYQNNQLDKEQSALTTQTDAQRLAQALALSDQVVPQTPGDVTLPPTEGLPLPQLAAPPPPTVKEPQMVRDTRQASVSALAKALASPDPAIQDMGKTIAQSLLTGSREEKAQAARAAEELAQREFQSNQRQITERFQSGESAMREAGANARNQADIISREKIAAQKPVPQDMSTTPFEAWQKQNPGKPIADWLKLSEKPANPYLDAMRQINIENQSQAAPGQVVYKATGKPVAAKDLTDTATTKISDLQNLIGQADKVKGILDKLGETGAIKGYVMREGVHLPVIQGTLTPEQAEAVSEVYRLANSYIYAVSGKAIAEKEFDRIMKTAPSITYTKQANEVILRNFRDYAQKGLDNFMRVNGWALKEGPAAADALGSALDKLFGPAPKAK